MHIKNNLKLKTYIVYKYIPSDWLNVCCVEKKNSIMFKTLIAGLEPIFHIEFRTIMKRHHTTIANIQVITKVLI